MRFSQIFLKIWRYGGVWVAADIAMDLCIYQGESVLRKNPRSITRHLSGYKVFG
jgi:hypothetical protein